MRGHTQHTVYLTAGQWEAVKKLDPTAPSIMQESLMSGSEYAGHVLVTSINGEQTHLDREGNIVKRPSA